MSNVRLVKHLQAYDILEDLKAWAMINMVEEW
jgi:hypothetical protein